MPAGVEQRRSRRFSRQERINLLLAKGEDESVPATETLATLTDISLGGFGVMTEKPLLSGQALYFNEKIHAPERYCRLEPYRSNRPLPCRGLF